MATEFNGVLRKVAAEGYEIAANDQILSGNDYASVPHHLEREASGFYRACEYTDLSKSRNYSVRFLDGGLVQYYCHFEEDQIKKQRLCFYQSPLLRPYDISHLEYDTWINSATDTEEEARVLFAWEEFEYRDVVSFRIEYVPTQYQSVVHPSTHFHLNSFESCRIPVTGPIGVSSFFRFIVKNFYNRSWFLLSPQLVDQVTTSFAQSIDDDERNHIHFSIPD